MILFFGIQLLPLVYAFTYLRHSMKKRRTGQGIAAGALLLLLCAALAVLLWEYLSVP